MVSKDLRLISFQGSGQDLCSIKFGNVKEKIQEVKIQEFVLCRLGDFFKMKTHFCIV